MCCCCWCQTKRLLAITCEEKKKREWLRFSRGRLNLVSGWFDHWLVMPFNKWAMMFTLVVGTYIYVYFYRVCPWHATCWPMSIWTVARVRFVLNWIQLLLSYVVRLLLCRPWHSFLLESLSSYYQRDSLVSFFLDCQSSVRSDQHMSHLDY